MVNDPATVYRYVPSLEIFMSQFKNRPHYKKKKRVIFVRKELQQLVYKVNRNSTLYLTHYR
jgi:hypothetical protein